jgi:CheY-like chemotaxis protein
MQNLVQDTFPKDIVFRADLENSLPLLFGDHTQMHQVLLNLCVNARDAMPDGGTLTVTARGLLVDETYAGMTPGQKPGKYLNIKVTDTGSGIPQEMLAKIFDPFFTTKEVGKGTGLGLSTALAIVKSHGGFLNVYSEPGKGTTFSLFFPASDTVGLESELAQENVHPRGDGQLILIVDDEAAVRTITRQTLEMYGYRVLVAEEGSEAVALYLKHRTEVAAVVTDMMMPVMAGEVTIQVLRRLDPRVKIIAASGLVNDDTADQAAAMGVKHFLPKPFTAQTILRTLHQVLNDGD